MKTIIVDDDLIAMQGFKIECENVHAIELVGEFNNPLKALQFAATNKVDVAFLDIEMPEMNGLELGTRLKEMWPGVIIVYVTSHSGFAAEAIRMKADYVVFKPYGNAEIEDVMERIMLLRRRLKKRIYCKTFGRFDVFIDDKPVAFKTAKAKELFALCVSRRGGVLSTDEIVDKLWENFAGNPGECSTFRSTAKALKDLLAEYGLQDVFCHERGRCYVNTDLIDSDFYSFLEGDPHAVCEFQGEFMSDYFWGENIIYEINEKKSMFLKRRDMAEAATTFAVNQ